MNLFSGFNYFLLMIVALKADSRSLAERYKASELIVSGRIIRMIPFDADEQKTNLYSVTIEIKSIMKQDFYIDDHILTLTWRIPAQSRDAWIHEGNIDSIVRKPFFFFLTRMQCLRAEAIGDDHVVPFGVIDENELLAIDSSSRIVIDHYSINKTCKASCRLCKAIKKENWESLKWYLLRSAKRKSNENLMTHRRIKWVSADRHILASLPSYMGMRMLLKSEHREVHAYAGFQVGYYKSFMRWMPFLLYKLFHAQATKYFTSERHDVLILKKFIADSNYSQQYFNYLKENDMRLITDTNLVHRYGRTMILPDEYVLLADVFEGDLRLYLDFQTLPDYLDRCTAYIRQLQQEKKVYLLSLIVAHTVPSIAGESLKALRELDDPRCLGMLLKLAEYAVHQLQEKPERYQMRKDFVLNLMMTINLLTRTNNPIPDVTFSDSSFAEALGRSIPVWKKKLHVIDSIEPDKMK